MCYSLTDSIVAFIINITSSMLLFIKYHDPKIRLIAIFSAYIGVMQFWDIIFWLNPGKTKMNYYSTKMATLWLHMEPIVLVIIIWHLFKIIKNATLTITIIYAIGMVAYIGYYWKDINYTGRCCGNKIVWDWNYKKYSGFLYIPFFLSFMVAIYQYLDGPIMTLSIIYISFTYIFSLYKYNIDKNSGRFWCFFGAFYPLIILLSL